MNARIKMRKRINPRGDVMMRTILIYPLTLVVAVLVLSTSVMAQGGDRTGSAAADQVLVPVGARGIALGSSYLAGITGTEAIYYNPAGLSGSTTNAEVLFSQMNIIGDVNVSYMALSANFGGFGHIGLSVKTFGLGDITLTTERQPDGTGAVYSPTFLTLGLTYSRALTDRIRAGVTVNFISEEIDRVSQNGTLFDVGVQYSGLAGLRGLMLGVTLRHLGGNMSYDGPGLLRRAEEVDGKRDAQLLKIDAADFNVPTSLELGLAYDLKVNDLHKVLFAGSFENNNFLSDQYRAGAEYSYKDMFFIRSSYTFAGDPSQIHYIDGILTSRDAYNTAVAEEEAKKAAALISGIPYVQTTFFDTESGYIYGLALGVGVKYDAGSTQLRFDYAYRDAEVFLGNHVFTFGIGF
jgi:hypothetical protein